MLLSFNDICLIPATVSDIEHRSECNPYLDNGMLPLFTAPMTSVIDENNWQIFRENKINTIIPRSVSFQTRRSLYMDTFVAVSLSEFEHLIEYDKPIATIYICVDIANGHMKKLLNLCKQAKKRFGDMIQIMAGNIANPETYFEYAKAGIDYVRCGIGTSPICTTSANSGVHYPMVSLLEEIDKRKNLVELWISRGEFDYGIIAPKIVADGGFSNFDQIIKALAIGADYVMLGKIFAMSKEACGEVTEKFTANGQFRKYYGMSTKKAQAEFGNTELKTAEGIETLVPIKYTLAGWCDNFISYLRSAMSYTNSRNLNEFKNTQYEQISANSFNAYYK